jgi:hypothetical protein
VRCGGYRAGSRSGGTRLSIGLTICTSSNGKCCSFADGLSSSDIEWDTEDGHYRVRLHGEWVNVPNSSVVTEANRYVPAVTPTRSNRGQIEPDQNPKGSITSPQSGAAWM